MRARARPAVSLLVAAAGVVVAGAGLVLALATRDAGSSQDDTISAAELAALPPIAFTWADRNKRTRAGDLYVVDADGTDLRRVKAWPPGLAEDRAYGAEDVAWSPDRSQIAVETWVWIADPASQMALVATDGRRLRTLDGLRGPDWGDRSFAWSPTGELLFSRFHELYVVGPSAGHLVRIWRSTRDDRFDGVDWAPDGKEIVAGSSARGLVGISPNGAEPPRLLAGGGLDPEWSPDGRTIVFRRDRVSVVGRDGRDAHPVNPGALGGEPHWSPNGRWIAFTGDKGVLAVRATGRRLRRLTTDATDAVIDWSPDGSKILFRREARDREKPRQTWWELWVMDSDGGRETRLQFNKPGWSVLAADWRS